MGCVRTFPAGPEPTGQLSAGWVPLRWLIPRFFPRCPNREPTILVFFWGGGGQGWLFFLQASTVVGLIQDGCVYVSRDTGGCGCGLGGRCHGLVPCIFMLAFSAHCLRKCAPHFPPSVLP